MRIPGLETGILSLGYRELAHEFADIADADARRSALNAKVWLTYIRQLNNLSLQESRLRRQREKDTAALQQLQAERSAAVKQQLDEAARQYAEAAQARTGHDWTPETGGFVFSKDEIAARARYLQPALFHDWSRRNLKKPAA